MIWNVPDDSSILDPRAKKAQDPGSGSASLAIAVLFRTVKMPVVLIESMKAFAEQCSGTVTIFNCSGSERDWASPGREGVRVRYITCIGNENTCTGWTVFERPRQCH
jgi:hypothetical protein